MYITLRRTLSILVLASFFLIPLAQAASFTDIEGHWAEEEIEIMASIETVAGNPDGSFDPDGNLNRAEAATLIFRIANIDEATEGDGFSDVDIDDWYGPYVYALSNVGIISGNPDGSFEPRENINRAEFLQLVILTFSYVMDIAIEVDEITDVYVDLNADAWYAEGVSYATSLELVGGSECDDGRCFHAENFITRAEATVILFRLVINAMADVLLNTVEDEPDDDSNETSS